MRGRPRFSQHFLVDRGIAARIVASFAPAATDRVVEIGPGKGVLTALVAPHVAACFAVEIDRRLASPLRARLRAVPGFEIIEGDALTVALATFARDGRVRVLGNLPYHISTPIVLKLLEETASFRDATVMLQREYAERLAAVPGTKAYGSLTVLVQSRVSVRALFDVPPRAFDPPPGVVSQVLELTPLATPLVTAAEWAWLKALLRAAFSARRKTLANALSAGLRLTRERAAEALAGAGIDPGARAETLSPARWADITRLAALRPADGEVPR